jgi:hypothetical protein
MLGRELVVGLPDGQRYTIRPGTNLRLLNVMNDIVYHL